jgi:biopolymer transport protein ExbD
MSMRLSKARSHAAIGVNLTPMIDIVFLLIIFFITVSQITPIIQHPVELPQAQVLADASPTVKLTVNIDSEGAIFVAGSELSQDQLMARVTEMARESGSQIEDLQILIRCDRRAESRHVNQLIPRFSELGITQIKISVLGQEE